MDKVTLQFELTFDDDVYVGRTRGSYPQYMLNSGYSGIRIVDVVAGRILRTIPFPRSIHEFCIETWLVSPEGKRSYLFDRGRGGSALEIEHDTSLFRRVILPNEFEAPTGLCWFTPELHMRDFYGRNWVMHDGTVEEAPPEAIPDNLRTRLRLDGPDEPLGVMRVSYDHHGLYVMNRSEIGFVSLNEHKTLLAPHDGSAVDVAALPDDLLVCTNQSVKRGRDKVNEVLLTAPSRESFCAIETLATERKLFLLVLSARKDGTGSNLRGFLLHD